MGLVHTARSHFPWHTAAEEHSSSKSQCDYGGLRTIGFSGAMDTPH